VAWFKESDIPMESVYKPKKESVYEPLKALEITIFVEARRGFSKLLADATTTFPVLLNGPYGKLDDISKFDKIQFISEGIGVAAQLSVVKILLHEHDEHKARVRRIDIAWYSKGKGGYDRPYYLSQRLIGSQTRICS